MPENIFTYSRKKLISILILTVVILIVGVAVGLYFGKNKKPINNPTQNSNQAIQADDKHPSDNQPTATEDHPLIKDDFSILLPKGWRETAPAMQGITLSAMDMTSDFSDPAVKRINFRNNYNVSYDQLKNRNMDQYTEYIKGAVKQMSPNIVFSNEGILAINGREAHIFEGEMQQQGVEFHVIVFLIQGNSGDVWNISFNCLKSQWNNNALLFSRVANSFEVKK